MLLSKKIANLADGQQWSSYQVDYIDLEWYELNKRILRKLSRKERDVGIQLAITEDNLLHGDILSVEENEIIVINVLACECIAIHLQSMQEMAKVCYEIGNRHAPLFSANNLDESTLLLPMDKPLLVMLDKLACRTSIIKDKLIKPLGGAARHSLGHAHSHQH